MLALKWLSVLALAALAAAADVVDTDVPELVIDKTYVPANCTVKSAKGDWMRVHYVGAASFLVVWFTVTEPLPILQTGKLTNGNKFDSRYVLWASLRDSPAEFDAYSATITATNHGPARHSPVRHNVEPSRG